MHVLGTVIGISASGFAIIRCEKAPRVNAPIFNINKKKTGVVADIIGPANEPYVLVKSTAKTGQKLFVGD